MTALHLVQVSQDELEEIAFNSRAAIETTAERAYLRLGDTTYVAELGQEQPC